MNRLLQMLQGRTIAIVGNGNVRSNFSSEIDSADVVMRFNHFYNYDSQKVGKRVDIIMQTITQTWYDAQEKHIGVIRGQKPNVFIVKRPDLYTSKAHFLYGKDVRVDNLSRFFEPWWHFTTGTCVLTYLAKNLNNAKVKCYGFQDEEDWERYMSTDAKHYEQVKDEERIAMLSAIDALEHLTITEEHKETPNVIVIPIKKDSKGAPNKNRLLIRHCLGICLKQDLYPIHIVGDDVALLRELNDEFGGKIHTCALPKIEPLSDVTTTLKDWRNKTGYVGNITLVQCTSPKLNEKWIMDCVDGLKYAPISATACELSFKANSIFRLENNVYYPCSNELPPASTARQILPHTVRINGAVEAFHTDALDYNSFFEVGTLRPIIVCEADSMDVDDMDTLQKALALIDEQQCKKTDEIQ